MCKNPIVKNQHYVPQSYLKHFAIKNEERIYVYDKTTKKSFSSSIRNISAEKYFYDLPEEAEKLGFPVQYFEKLFSGIEGNFASTHKNLIENLENNNFTGFSDEEKEFISNFVIIQFLRTKQDRIVLNDSALQFYREYLYSLTEKNFPIKEYPKEIYPEISMKDENENIYQLVMIERSLNDPNLKNNLKKYIWIILKNETETPFISSDNPLVNYIHKKNPAKPETGMFLLSNELFLPLSPQYGIVFLDVVYFSQLLNKNNTIIPVKDKEHIKLYNFLQTKDSHRQVFSSINDFSIFDEIEQKLPDVLKTGRRKSEISSIIEPNGREFFKYQFIDEAIHNNKIIGTGFFTQFRKLSNSLNLMGSLFK
jgi:hypothetical protein